MFINIIVGWIMVGGRDVEEKLNMGGGYLDVIREMVGCIGGVIGGVVIIFFRWGWGDGLGSVIVGILVVGRGFYVRK
ncbi:hypothetical protein [Staphylococcus epidermidis]|uniref:hypothetical protein n=1 Tax=Staphylococcus epidermidis TaxID=1282 RepID=UPI0011A2B772|nr:hypothetical protein [Staphylococcus epidermidis]